MFRKLNKLLLKELSMALAENVNAYPDKATLVNVMHPNSLRKSVVSERDYKEAVKRLEKEYEISLSDYDDLVTEIYTFLKTTSDPKALDPWIKVLRKENTEKPDTDFEVILTLMLDIQQHLQEQEHKKDAEVTSVQN